MGDPTEEQGRENTAHQEPDGQRLGRRKFMRKAGGSILSLSVLGFHGISANPAYGQDPINGPYCTPPPAHDPDSLCSLSNNDEACYIEIFGGKDRDEHCAVNGDSDDSCGDCNDNHENDEACGSGGGQDSDDLCGHIHWPGGGGAEDQHCGLGARDQGCGYHDTVYNGENDEDQNCFGVEPGGTDPDAHCASPMNTSDESCGVDPPSFSSNPDEMCSGTDVDEACGTGGDPAYDRDASCGPNPSDSSDQSCGAQSGIWADSDALCSATDVDEYCRNNVNIEWVTDESASE